MEASRSMWSALVDIIVAPKQALRAVDDHVRWLWLPFLLTLVSAAAIWAYYYAVVDIEWLRAHLLSLDPDLTGEQREAASNFMTRNTMMISTLVTVPIVVVLIYLIYSLYLHLVAKSAGESARGFGHWFALTSWASVPAIIGVLAMFGFLLAKGGDGQITQNELNVLSLNALIFHYPDNHALAGLLNGISLINFWIIGLTALGWKMWRNSTWGKALLVVALPYIVIWGAMLAWAMFS